MQTVGAEHELNTTLWGRGGRRPDPRAHAVIPGEWRERLSPPPETVQVAGPGINTAMATEFGQMSTRLFSSPYFKSVDALFTLATLRAATLLHVLPLLLVFMGVCAIDGFAVRSVRAREFADHSAGSIPRAPRRHRPLSPRARRPVSAVHRESAVHDRRAAAHALHVEPRDRELPPDSLNRA